MLLQDPETLDVQEGFWKGVNAANLHTVFAPEEEREAELKLLADYTGLFGKGFTEKDITPYVQEWARGIVRSEGLPDKYGPSSIRRPADTGSRSRGPLTRIRQTVCLLAWQ